MLIKLSSPQVLATFGFLIISFASSSLGYAAQLSKAKAAALRPICICLAFALATQLAKKAAVLPHHI